MGKEKRKEFKIINNMNQGFSDNNLHDRVISEIKNVLNQNDFDIYTNPGQEKNAGIGNNYPDVIMTAKGTTNVRFILEIETDESVTWEEAINQWKKYYNEINATFYLVVPQQLLSKAVTLCQQAGINVRYITYSINYLNNITFNFN